MANDMLYIRNKEMKNKIDWKRTLIKYLPFLLFMLYSAYLHSKVGMRDWDDYVYKEAWTNTTLWQWIKDFYAGWSGRIPIQMLNIVFLQFPIIIWRLCDTILYTLAAFLVSKVACLFGDSQYKTEIMTNVAVCLAFVAIPSEVLNRVILWIAGSFNYLLPSTCMLVALYPFFQLLNQHTVKKREMLIALAGTFLCCYAEQTAAVFVCLSGFILFYALYHKRQIARAYWGLLIFGIINMIIEYIAPGNYVRYDSEVILWYIQYDMYSVMDKLLLGLTFCVKMILTYGWMIFVIIFVLILPKVWKDKIVWKLMYAGCAIYTIVLRYIIQQVNENYIFSLSNVKSPMLLFLIIFWILLLTSMVFVLYFDKMELAITISLVMLAAFAAGTVVAMSPSCYEAEQRVFFVSYILLIMMIGLQVQGLQIENKNNIEKGQKNEKVY